MTSQPRPAVRVVGVKRLADYLKRKTESDANLKVVAVRGEITNMSVAPSGHVNFDLKEGDVVLRCFAWADDAAGFPVVRNGLAVVATGAVSTYAAKSTYQLVVRFVEPEGLGDVYTLFEQRKKKLAADGIFDPARKRALPLYPFRVALVSSRRANGAIDFVTILRQRAPHVRVVWCETSVQGPNAPDEIVAALGRASRADVDCIVVTRGGGSFEDLFAFSDERVVRAVAKAAHPVIAAIGHTADQQLCDFAADVHVETPSAAAKAVGSEARELRARLAERTSRARAAVDLRLERLSGRLSNALVRSKLAEPRVFFTPLAQRLDDTEAALVSATTKALRAREGSVRDYLRRLEPFDPTRALADRARRLAAAAHKLDAAVATNVERARARQREGAARLTPAARGATGRLAQSLALLRAHLDGKNPEAILQRGYAIVTHDGVILRDATAVSAGALIEARLARGTISARVEPERHDGDERIG